MALFFAISAHKSLEQVINERVKDSLDARILSDRLIKKYSFQKIADKYGYSIDGIKKRYYKAKKAAHL